MSKDGKERAQSVNQPRRTMPWGDLPHAVSPAQSGILLVDKDQNVTSHDVVGAMRRLAGTRKVGHGGTLDPMATGLLTVGIGRATKLLTYFSGCEKTYLATICLGARTNTEDADGQIILPDAAQLRRLSELTVSEIDAEIAALTGEIMQVPSSFSALKIDGKRSHELMRSGAQVHLDPRPITIHRFRRLTQPLQVTTLFDFPVVIFDVEVACSAGTYIRALARDLGDALKVGAHLRMLRRAKVRQWDVNEARSIAQYAELVCAGEQLPVISMSRICRELFPVLEISDEEASALGNGQFIQYRAPKLFAVSTDVPAVQGAKEVAAFTSDGKVIALLSRRGRFYKPDLQLSEN